MRALHIGRALQQIGDVEVILVEHPESGIAARLGAEVEGVPRVELEELPRKNVLGKISWSLDPRASYPHGLCVNQASLARVIRKTETADVTWFFKLRTANAFGRWAWPRSVVDVDDLPSTFEESLLNAGRRNGERLATAVRVWSWKRRERLLGERFNVLAVCSDTDRRYLRSLGVDAPLHVIPNGFERPNAPPVRKRATPTRIGFIGVFDHEPNVAGIRWFVHNTWPLIKREIPDARLRLVGRLSDGPLGPRGVDVDALGWLPDPSDEMATWSAMVVPVQIGAGTRGKIAHAFSQKCPVVSTSLGAYGYDARDGHDMYLADTAETFAEACVRTIREPDIAAAMAERAWQQFLEKWTWDAIRLRVSAAVEDCLKT